MLTQSQARELKELLEQHLAPVLSLYLDTNPSRPENAGKAYELRARAALEEAEVPEAVYSQVKESFLSELPLGKTRMLFATADWLDYYDLQIELPLVDGVEAHWGEVYLTPVLYALDEFERYGVVCISQDKARMFELFLGEIEELPGAFRALPSGTWRSISNDSQGRGYTAGTMTSSRAAANTDVFEHRVAAWTHRYFKHLASLLEQVVRERGISRLLLLGPQTEMQAFVAVLPRWLRERLAATLPALPSILASQGEVLKTVEGALEGLERQSEDRLLEQVAEKALSGLDQVLQALQEGRVERVVVPWKLDQTVFACPQGWVATSPEAASAYCPDQVVKATPLKVHLPELAVSNGARLDFVRGDAARRLNEEFGGMAGFPRY